MNAVRGLPLFMEGVEHLEQLDDTRLHLVAKVGVKTNEWDAKILEQHPDKQISWISEDGKKTRGTVTFEPIGESRTRITLSMSYQAEGLTESLGSAVGLHACEVTHRRFVLELNDSTFRTSFAHRLKALRRHPRNHG